MNLRARFFLSVGFLGLLCLTLTGSALADPSGTAAITNCTPGGGVTISATMITWLPTAGTNLGCIATGLPTSISYSGGTFTSGTGTISDLPGGSINPFIVLAGGLLDFSLTSFEAPTPSAGICSTSTPLASGQSCILFAGSPFLLYSEGPTSTAISWIANGVATDTGNSDTTSYFGLFSSQIDENTASIAAVIDNDGSITNTYSGTLSLSPEPPTYSLFAVGLVLFGLGRKRFGKREAQ